jgi:5-methylcytosine-specific restriction endonuclease McrA
LNKIINPTRLEVMANSKKNQTWKKGKVIRGENPNAWRRDSKGKKIRYGSYGTKGKYGWEIDHIRPKAKGGSNSLTNLQPLQWKANRKKADK